MDYAAPITNQFNENAKYELGLKVTADEDIHDNEVENEDFIWKFSFIWIFLFLFQ